MYYHGKDLNETEWENLTQEQKDISLLETHVKMLHETSIAFTKKCSEANVDYTESCMKRVINAFKNFFL